MLRDRGSGLDSGKNVVSVVTFDGAENRFDRSEYRADYYNIIVVNIIMFVSIIIILFVENTCVLIVPRNVYRL